MPKDTKEAKSLEVQQKVAACQGVFHHSKLCTVFIHNKPDGIQVIFAFCHG